MNGRLTQTNVKPNRRFLGSNERAEVGIGTLIVFIAMILVAAIGAAVLIETSGMLQQRAQATGDQAMEQVGTNFEAVGVYGNRTGTSGNMEDVTIQIHLLPGAQALDLSKLSIRYTDGASLRTLSWDQNAARADSATKFNATILRDVSGTFSYSDPVIGQGDLVEVRIYSVDLGTRTNVQISMTPEAGTGEKLDFRTPTSYGTAKYVQFM